jgi:phosphate transport system protein
MSQHLYRDLETLRRRLLQIGSMVERSIQEATTAFLQCDAERAQQVVRGDRDVDVAEVRLEEDCLKILALHQPVAGGQRVVMNGLKVNNDRERKGDAAESRAARTVQLAALPKSFQMPAELSQMAAMALGMARKALDCLQQEDARIAREILDDDLEVDSAQRRIFEVMQQRMREHSEDVDAAVLTLSTSRQIERIADLATNIAEDVIFLREGEIVRHKRSQLRLV